MQTKQRVKQLSEMQQSNVLSVKLNVGGVKYTTSLSTLTAVPDSFFASLFSGDWQSVTTAEGDVFVDRDGEVPK